MVSEARTCTGLEVTVMRTFCEARLGCRMVGTMQQHASLRFVSTRCLDVRFCCC